MDKLSTETLQRLRTLLVPSLATDPEAVAALHDIGEHGTAEEHHVLSARRILDTLFKVREA